MNMQIIPSFDIRNAFRDPRAVHFQDDIRRAMLASRTPGQMVCPAPDAVPAPMGHAQNCRAVLMHLADGEDGRTGISAVVPLPYRTMDRVLGELRDRGHITQRRRDRAALYHITAEGLAAIDAPMPAAKEPKAPGAPRQKRGPSAANVDAVFALLRIQPATRVEMQRALGVGSSTMEECLRALRLQDRITWERNPVTNIKTYRVRAADIYRDCGERGLSKSETARALGVSVQAVDDMAVRHNIVFRDGRKT